MFAGRDGVWAVSRQFRSKVKGLLSCFWSLNWTISILISLLLCTCVLSCFSRILLFVTPWSIAHQALLSVQFTMQEYWGGFPLPSSRDLPDKGIKPSSLVSPALRAILYFWATGTLSFWISVFFSFFLFIFSRYTSRSGISESCCSCCLVAKLCLTLNDLIDYRTPGSSVLHYLPELAQVRVHWVSDAI